MFWQLRRQNYFLIYSWVSAGDQGVHLKRVWGSMFAEQQIDVVPYYLLNNFIEASIWKLAAAV